MEYENSKKEQLRNLYLEKYFIENNLKEIGTITKDQPWKKFHTGVVPSNIPKRTVYQEVYENNLLYLYSLTLEYFGTKINFETFFSKIDNTAKALQEYDVKKGEFVTVCAAGIPETAYTFYALSKLGAVANMIAPYFDKKEFINRVADCESNLLIVMDIFYNEIKEAVKKSRIKNIIVLPTFNSSLLRFITPKYKLQKHSNEIYWNQFIKDGIYRTNTVPVEYEKDMPLTLVYSSGTSGASKGILLSNDSFQNSIHAYAFSGLELLRGNKFYQIIPPWYSTGLSTSIHLPLSYGCAVFMDPRFERDAFVKNISRAKINYSLAPTSMYEGFLDKKLVKNRDYSSLKFPFEGGEPLRKDVAVRIEEVLHKHGSKANILVGYGQCEGGATITTENAKTKHSEGSVGVPLPGVTIGIFDENYNELPYGKRGMILANTPSSMLEYYCNKEATEEYFYYDKDGKKWNCTGDIGYIDKDGILYVEGRACDYTMINSKKIYNFDIENIIMISENIKMCDVLPKVDEDGNQTFAVHIIFDDEFNKKVQSDIGLLNKKLEELQSLIYEVTQDNEIVPYIFKIRESFPHAKSGKRDISSLNNEKDGFIIFNKFNVDNKQKILK